MHKKKIEKKEKMETKKRKKGEQFERKTKKI